MKLEFVEEPPAPGDVRSRAMQHWKDVAETLRARPGKWAKVPPVPGTKPDVSSLARYARKINAGTAHGFKEGRWSARAANGALYVRYDGEA